MKHHAPQLEVNWTDPEPFTLVVQTTTDGARAEQQAEAQRLALLEHEKQQPQLL